MAAGNEFTVDRGFLERLERLTIRWQRSFPGLVGGHNLSGFPGSGQEFLDHRHFHHGDDLRAVNWRAYLRLEKLFLKMFRIEPHTPIRMLIDTSQSMNTGAIPKYEYARKLAAAFCYIGLVRLDTICIQPFAGELGETCICSGGRHRFAPAARFLAGLECRGKSDFLKATKQFVGRHIQRGLTIILSDFLDDEDCRKPLQYLADYGHELLLIQLWADEDRDPPWEGELDLVDAETGTQLHLQLDTRARESYTASFDQYCDQIRSLALRSGGRYAGFSTSVSIEDAIFGPIARTQGVA
jgi:uncharacterized protein (DUF58 family)